jgi:quercetin dioxygenase-like cupin family protein
MIRCSVCYVAAGLLISTSAAMGEDVPDALSVEWQGQHPCEKLYEDAQIRVLHCTLAPGAVHVRHSHPGGFVYTLSGGKTKVQDDRGTREGEASFPFGKVRWPPFAAAASCAVWASLCA